MESKKDNPDAPPWSPDGIRLAGEELASVLDTLPRDQRGVARALLRQAWMRAESDGDGRESSFALGRELDRWIRRARGCPEALSGWMKRGGYFSLRRKRRVKAPRAIDWTRVSNLEERGRFHLDRQARHDWLWSRCTERSAGQRPEGGVATERRELPMGLELVWSESTD